MSNINVAFCSGLLHTVRMDAKKYKVKIPKLSTWCEISGNNKYYEVHAILKKDCGSEIIWQGAADNANDAKFKAIINWIDSELKERGLDYDTLVENDE